MIALHSQHNIPFPEKKKKNIHPSRASASSRSFRNQPSHKSDSWRSSSMPLEVQQVSKGFPKLKGKLTHSLTHSIHPPKSFTHKLWGWTTHHEKSNKTYLSFKLNPSFGSVSTTIFKKKNLMAFSPSTLLPNSPPQKKKLPNSSNKPEETHARVAWRGLRVLFNSVLHFHKTINFPKENCAKIIRPSTSFEKSTTILPNGTCNLRESWGCYNTQMIRMLLPGQKKSSSNWTNTWGLSKFLTRFVEAMLNSSQDRLLQMSSYVAILETAKGCYSKCMSLDAIRYGWQLANGAERAKKSQNFTEKNTDNSAVTICSYPTCQSAAVRQN